jgi:3-isopropylmalate dehydrogenase
MVVKSIAVLEGDGIGPEIMREGIKVLGAVSKKYNHDFNIVYVPFGAQAYIDEGHSFPDETKEVCNEADSILKGPIGLPLTEMKKIPVECAPETSGLLPLRRMLDAYVNYRPIFLKSSYSDISPLKSEVIVGGIDILMMRELVGGIYFGEKREGKSTGYKYARDDCCYTREQVERFANAVFSESRKRKVKVTNVHKANILASSRFWNYIFEEVSRSYPDVKLESMLVDNVACQLVRNPAQFNGIMSFENMQGDIITDLAGGVIGSLGLMPSACINPQTGKGYYEPAHGSAPDIAGQNIANPYSMIGSVAFMLEKSFGLTHESEEIWNALEKVLSYGYRTRDLSKTSTSLISWFQHLGLAIWL